MFPAERRGRAQLMGYYLQLKVAEASAAMSAQAFKRTLNATETHDLASRRENLRRPLPELSIHLLLE